MITAVVYGKEDCDICQSAAEKLERLNIPHTKENIEDFTEIHDGWQEDDSIEIMRAMCNQNHNIPVIKLDLGNGDVRFTSYPEAMAVLKQKLDRKPQESSMPEATA